MLGVGYEGYFIGFSSWKLLEGRVYGILLIEGFMGNNFAGPGSFMLLV